LTKVLNDGSNSSTHICVELPKKTASTVKYPHFTNHEQQLYHLLVLRCILKYSNNYCCMRNCDIAFCIFKIQLVFFCMTLIFKFGKCSFGNNRYDSTYSWEMVDIRSVIYVKWSIRCFYIINTRVNRFDRVHRVT